MVTSEIRDTVLIGVAAVLLSALIGFVAYMMSLRGEFAEIRNTEVHTTASIASYREFNKFNGAVLYGEDVVAAIREYHDTDIKIRVNNSSWGKILEVDKYFSRQNPSIMEVGNLQIQFPVTQKYEAVLVYGNEDLNRINASYNPTSSMDTDVTAIVFRNTGTR